MKKRNVLLISLLTLAVIALLTATYLFFFDKRNVTDLPDKPPLNENKIKCLEDDEWAEVIPHYWDISDSKVAEDINVYVVKKGEIDFNKISGEELKKQLKEKNRFNFFINDVASSAYMPDILKCGVYVVRIFEDEKRDEFWHYDYSGKGRSVLILDEFGKDGNSTRGIDSYHSYAKVDPTETYVALVRTWVGDENHALVIKNLKTMEDAYVVTLKELVEKYGIEPGTIQLSGWYKNIFQFEIIFPSERNPWFRLDSNNWKLEKTETVDEMLEKAGELGEEGIVE